MTLNEYVTNVMKPQERGKLGSGKTIMIYTSLYSSLLSVDTLYHFGDNDREEWSDLFSLYNIPPYNVPGLEPVISFGVAGMLKDIAWRWNH